MGRKFIITSIILIFLYGIYLYAIPAVINQINYTDLVEKNVYKKSGIKISIQNPKIKTGILPSIWIKADNFAIINSDNSNALELSNLQINIQILPLILKKLNIKHFSADSIEANIIFDKNFCFKLGEYSLETLPKSDFKLNHLATQINSYKINLDDKFQKKFFTIEGDYFVIDDFTDKKHLNLSTNTNINFENKKSVINTNLNIKLPINKISENQINLTGNIINLDLSDFSIYAKSLSKNKIKSISGIINSTTKTEINKNNHKKIKTNISIKNLGIFKDDIQSSIFHKGKLEIISDINTLNNGIEVNEVKIIGNGINIFTSGTITKLNSKIPNLHLKISIDKTKAENILPLLPGEENLSPDMDLLLLKQTGFWGDASANLEIKGKADLPQVFGNVLITNAYMVKPIPNAQKAVIKLSFLGDKFNLDVKVPTSPTETVWVKGPINLDKERSADLNITSTKNVDLKTAQIVLNPLHKILHFDIGPVPIMDIKGKGGINLHIVGTRQNPHGWGQFWFNSATVSFLDIHNLEIKNGSGTLDFDNQNTIFKSKTAFLNGKPISIDGTCSLLGDLDFNVSTNEQNLENLLKTVKTSPMLKDIQTLLTQIENISGPANINLNLTGQVKDINDVVFNKNIFAKGSLELLTNTLKIKNMPPLKLSGLINFQNLDADFNLKSILNSSKIDIKGKIKDNICNTKIVSDKFNVADGIDTLQTNIPYKKDLSTINTSFFANYKGPINNIEFDKIYIKGKIYNNKGSKSSIIVENSTFELNNSTFKLPQLKGTLKSSPYYLSLNISKIFDKNKNINADCNIQSLDLNLINDKNLRQFIPVQISKQLENINFNNGKIDINTKIRNNNVIAYSNLENINLTYNPKQINFSFKSGNLLLKNNTLNINKVIAQFGEMPIFLNGKISNIQKNPNLNLYLNAKPTQDFFDQFINNNTVYPIKLKGDLILSSKLNGTLNNLNAKSILNIEENSNLYYMGATIGDIENPVKIGLDSTYSPNKIKINDFQYDKIINSQNNKPFTKTQLNASGILTMLDNNTVGFNNFKIKTQNPTDAKIFNIVFRKPFMKQGIFTSDIVLNGTSLNPKILGKFNITSIDIPFFDASIQDVNLDFKNDKIYLTSKGTVLTNEIYIDAILNNKLTPPYIADDVNIKLKNLDINKISDTIRDIEADYTRNLAAKTSSNQNIDITQMIINNATIQADKIQVRNINADNFITNLKLNEKMLLDIDNFKFDIAEGSVIGDLQHNLLTHKTNLDIHLDNANALIMSEALFDLKGQVYGSVNGDFNLVCNGKSQEDCFRTLSGKGKFNITDGRMPKLGSLEYLLKAGNLIKSGLTGLSINSIIDLITPLKTGNFESISGDVIIQNGTAENINIYSNGHDLNMYMTGSYNIPSSTANMQIYGSLSKNITTVFGKIKNASLNTLLNTIPGINNSNETILMQSDISKIPNVSNATDIYRIFAVEVNGNINGENYVKSFKWVK